MTPFTFVHAADLHLDSPQVGIGRTAPFVREMLRDASLEAFNRLVALTEAVDAAALVWAGDVFDHGAPSLRAQFRLKDGAERLLARDVAVFWAHGNHDPVGSLETAVRWPPNVVRFPAGEVTSYPLSREGERLAQVYGISYPSPAVTEPYWRRFVRQDDAPFAIGVLHANVGGDPHHDNYAPAALDDLRRQGFDYWALGHIHRRAVLSEEPWVVYPGNLQGRHVRETGRKGAYVVRVDPAGAVTLDFRPLNVVRWDTVEVDCTGLDSADAVEEACRRKLDALALDPDEAGCVVRLTLTGRTPLAGQDADWTDLAVQLSDDEPAPAFRWVESVDLRWRRPPEAGEPEGLWAEVVRGLRGPEWRTWLPKAPLSTLDADRARDDALRLLALLLDEVEPDAS
jgi:DNA repair exonuclease SbcCD nuclease subunit